MCITYIFFYRACKAQGIDRASFPYTGKFQPWCGWIGLVWMSLIGTSFQNSAKLCDQPLIMTQSAATATAHTPPSSMSAPGSATTPC